MAIFVPGIRDKRNRPKGNTARTIVASLSLTAMVDMFTVLVVFLLQNYNTDEIQITQKVALPEAQATKKLRPSNVVVITEDQVLINDEPVEFLQRVQDQEAWLIENLYNQLQTAIELEKRKVQENLRLKIQQTVTNEEVFNEALREKEIEVSRITVQASKSLDFLTVKKVLFTVTEAGASEINFAVVEKPEDK
jgi:biopolymer transport protein ExbD